MHDLEEYSLLLNGQMSKQSEWMKRYLNTSKCITSKSGLISLVWSFAVGTIYGIAYQPSNFMFLFCDLYIVMLAFVGSAIILCFYPLAGFLADNRYKTITRSLQIIFGCLIIGIITTMTSLFIVGYGGYDGPYFIAGLVGVIVFPVLIFFPLTVGFVGFNANLIQFGMDQLHDSPMDHQSLFIHWYVCVYYLAEFLSKLPWEIIRIGGFTPFTFWSFMLVVMLLLLLLGMVFFIVAHRRSSWFLIDSARVTPYKLVYEITKFARRHKTPLHRSAFTYWEEELPTGLDLGKDKYGGPFTTEQVEDVKAFYGILKILFALGPVFFLSFALDPTLCWYTIHLNHVIENISDTQTYYWSESYITNFGILLSYNFFNSLAVIVILLIYLVIIRPFRIFAIPKMLKRIGIGIIFLIASLLCVFGLVIASYHQTGNDKCIFRYFSNFEASNSNSILQNFVILFVQCCFFPLSNIFVYTALYEFICAQSPHSMKGLLIGLSFAIKGFYQALAAAMVFPFMSIDFHYLNCGVYYYMMNCVVGVVILVVYVRVARRYKHRQREDFCDVYRYAEEYYSKQ